MKQYHKCLETYDQGLKIEPENEELLEGIKRTIAAINARQNATDAQSEQEALNAAAQDPEIQEILSDPVVRKALQDIQADPKAAGVYVPRLVAFSFFLFFFFSLFLFFPFSFF